MGSKRSRRHAWLARRTAVGSSYCACGKCLLVDQFRHFHPLAVAEFEAAFERLQIRAAQPERRAQQLAILSGGLNTVDTWVLFGDVVHLLWQRIPPRGKRSR